MCLTKKLRKNSLHLNFKHDGRRLSLSGTSVADEAWELRRCHADKLLLSFGGARLQSQQQEELIPTRWVVNGAWAASHRYTPLPGTRHPHLCLHVYTLGQGLLVWGVDRVHSSHYAGLLVRRPYTVKTIHPGEIHCFPSGFKLKAQRAKIKGL